MENKTSILEPSLLKQLTGHRNSITALYYSPNEQQVASSSLDNSVLLWDLRSSMRSYRFEGHDEAVMDVTFASSGKYMASCSRDKTVRLWVPTVTGSTGVFRAHSQTVRSVQFSPDNTKIITASDDKIVKLWSSEKYKFLSSFVGHTNWVRCARMSNDGSIIASCSDDKTTRLWSTDNGSSIHTFKDQKGHGMHLAWHPSGCYIAVGTSQGNIKLYDVRTHNLVQYYSIHDDAVTQLAFHPSGSYIITSSKDGKMKILDLLEGHPIFTLSGHSGAVNSVNFSPSGNSFASGGEDKLVFIWQTNFTELENIIDTKEHEKQNSISKAAQPKPKDIKGKNQEARIWYSCYHSSIYPVVTFVHLDDANDETSNIEIKIQEPNKCSTPSSTQDKVIFSSTWSHRIIGNSTITSENPSNISSNSVGHMSQIPRSPPTRSTFTAPSVSCPKTVEINHEDEMFGMVKLGTDDVCYTSGTIEWVGRKRTYPMNSGFKVLKDKFLGHHINKEPCEKRIKKLTNEKTATGMECECAEILPTVNAIVDHLNALHEAVDIVDLRLNTLEKSMTKKDQIQL